MNIIVAILALTWIAQTRQNEISVAQFAAADDAGKRMALNDVAASKSHLAIEVVIELVRVAVTG